MSVGNIGRFVSLCITARGYASCSVLWDGGSGEEI